MDMKKFVHQVLQPVSKNDDGRQSWDMVWKAMLKLILEGKNLPSGTIQDLILAMQCVPRQSRDAELKTDLCTTFYATNRGPSLAFSELWCRVEDADGRTNWFHTTSRGQHTHAERQAVQRLQWQYHKPTHVIVYVNVSPCRDCAETFISYSEAHPDVKINIKFTSLFAHHASNHREGLRRMAQRGICLDVFDETDWGILTAAVNKSVTGKGNQNVPSSRKKRMTTRDANDVPSSKRQKT